MVVPSISGHRSDRPLVRKLVDFIIAHDSPAIFLLKDFHEFTRSAADIRRRLRDLYYACLNTNKYSVIASPVKSIPEEIQREAAFLTLPPPDLVELEALLRDEVQRLATEGKTTELSDENVYVLARALQGLTFNEARHAIRRAAAEHGRLDATVVPTLQEERRLLVRKTGLIEYVPDTAAIDQVGGVDVRKKWLLERRELFFSRESVSM